MKSAGYDEFKFLLCNKSVWPSGLRRQTQVLVVKTAWVRTPQLTFLLFRKLKVLCVWTVPPPHTPSWNYWDCMCGWSGGSCCYRPPLVLDFDVGGGVDVPRKQKMIPCPQFFRMLVFRHTGIFGNFERYAVGLWVKRSSRRSFSVCAA